MLRFCCDMMHACLHSRMFSVTSDTDCQLPDGLRCCSPIRSHPRFSAAEKQQTSRL